MDKQQRGFSLKMKLFLGFWALLCLLFFFVLRFPYDMFKPSLENFMSKYAGTTVQLGQLKGAFPLGIKATDVRIKDEDLAESLTLRPNITALFLGRAGVSFKLTQSKGSLQGNVRTSLIHPGSSFGMKLKFNDFDIAPMRSFVKKSPIEIMGLVNGKVSFQTNVSKFKESKGVISLNIKQGQMNFMMQNVAAASFPFDSFDIETKIEKGLLAIIKGELSGKDLSGKLSGNIRLGSRVRNSEMKISGNMKIPAGYRKMIGLRGEKADIRLNGMISRPYLSVREGPRVIFQTRY